MIGWTGAILTRLECNTSVGEAALWIAKRCQIGWRTVIHRGVVGDVRFNVCRVRLTDVAVMGGVVVLVVDDDVVDVVGATLPGKCRIYCSQGSGRMMMWH